MKTNENKWERLNEKNQIIPLKHSYFLKVISKDF